MLYYNALKFSTNSPEEAVKFSVSSKTISDNLKLPILTLFYNDCKNNNNFASANELFHLILNTCPIRLQEMYDLVSIFETFDNSIKTSFKNNEIMRIMLINKAYLLGGNKRTKFFNYSGLNLGEISIQSSFFHKYLRTLNLNGFAFPENFQFPDLPNLYSLKLRNENSGRIPDFSYLTKLKILELINYEPGRIRTNFIDIKLPNELSLFCISEYRIFGNLDDLRLPKSLVYLSISFLEGSTSLNTSKLPEGLSVLVLEDFAIRGNFDFRKLPKNLAVLEVKSDFTEDGVDFEQLPQFLEEITIQGDRTLVKVKNIDSLENIEEMTLQDVRIDDNIMRKTKLKALTIVDSVINTPMQRLFSTNLISLIITNSVINTSDLNSLPACLKNIEITCCHYMAPLLTKRLPRGLSRLIIDSTPMDSEIDFTKLPDGLKELIITKCGLIGNVDLTKLPSSLTKLNISHNNLTGEVDLGNLSENLQHIDITINNFSNIIISGETKKNCLIRYDRHKTKK